MVKEIRQGILFTLVTLVLLGGVYNVLLVGIGRLVFPAQAEGSLIRRADGTVVGSRLIGTEVHPAGVLPAAPVRRGLQRRLDWRHQLRAVEPGSPESRQGTARRA